MPSDRPPLLNGAWASVSVKFWLIGVGPPLRLKLKTVGLPDGEVTLSTMISPGTGIAMPGSVWQWHFDGAPGNACSGLVQRSFAPGSRQLRQVLTSRKPSPLVSTQATSMVWMLEYSGLWLASMSPQVSVGCETASRFTQIGSGAIGKLLTEHAPVSASPPSCATQTPMS
ncbi:MAG: hypothetical protein U0842_09420 [Candidatus Binatia bacterium]